jgi:hypothetical protein
MTMRLGAVHRCDRRNIDTTIGECVEGYVSATAMGRIQHPCCRCRTGEAIRRKLALEFERDGSTREGRH